MSHITVTPELLRKHTSAAGRLGGNAGSHRNKVRAGHAAQAKLLRKLAAKAARAGDVAQEKLLIERAQAHEKKAA